MLSLPTTIAEIERLIKHQVQENLHLEYKESRAIDSSNRKEIAKDVSAFANSDGGMLIYGIIESDNLPTGNDGGIDHSKYSREWLEQVISSNVTPRIDDIRISSIPVSTERSYYIIDIPKSYRGPHQSSDKKYYKRYNFLSQAMEDYEINDVRNRRRIVPPLVNVDILSRRMIAYLTVANVGQQTAEDVTFELPSELLPWIEKQQAKLFVNGIKYFPPNKSYNFRYGFINTLVHEGSKLPSQFDITVSYKHPDLECRISDSFHIDLMDYWGASLLQSEVREQGKEIKEIVKGLTDELRKLNGHVSKIATIAGATGLDLSVTTLRNLNHLVTGDNQIEKLDPSYLDYDVFMEVLRIDIETAYQLCDFFRSGNGVDGLNELEGITDQIIENIKKYFVTANPE